MLGLLFKFIRVMHSDGSPRQICLGLSLGMILGLTPLVSAHNLIVLLVILFFRINIGAAILSWGVFSLVAFIFDPLFHNCGLIILTKIEFLTGVWTKLYNAPFMPYTHFNNSILMGSLIFSLIAFYPLYRGSLFVVEKYRETIMKHVRQWKIIHIIKASSFFKSYARYSELKG